MTQAPTQLPLPCGLTVERLPSVKARTGLSRSTIYRRIALGNFPRQVKLGERASGWNTAEIDAWITDRIAARDLGAQG